MQTQTPYQSDIPTALAYDAHRHTSFTPDVRATQEQSGYANTLQSDYDSLAKLIVDHAERLPLLEAEFARYREGYRQRTLKHLASRARCASSMITGPSNFPVLRMEKRNEVAHRRLTDLLDYRERALAAIRRTLQPELRPIMSGDADATARLQEKIKAAKLDQEKFKAINAAIRKHRPQGPQAQLEAVAAALLGYYPGKNTTALAEQLLKPDFCGRIGYADYELTNNNANIRRMEQRLASIQRNQSLPTVEKQGAAATIEDCPAENRIRLTFPGKPSAEIRTTLKRGGFHWAPSLGVWQAYRHNHTIALAQQIAG